MTAETQQIPYTRVRKILPDDYINDLKTGYYRIQQGEKQLKSEYIVEYPMTIAKLMMDKKRNKPSHARKFYKHAVKVQRLLYYEEKSFEFYEAELKMLISHANYAQKRDMVTSIFTVFIEQNISQIKDKDDLDAFILHFQALIAYM